MRHSLAVLSFVMRRRAWNWLRRMASSPGRLIPLLLLTPALGLLALSAIAVLFIPAFAPEWEAGPLRIMLPYRDAIRSGILALLVLIGLNVASKALEGDLLAFQQADVDFLFPAPLSRRALLLVRLLSEYASQAAFALPLTLYLVLPLRISIPSRADGLWALEFCVASFALFVTLTNIGRLVQALVASRVDGLRWARAIRVALLGWVLLIGGALAADQLRGAEPLSTSAALLSSRIVSAAFAPCAIVADLYVAPLDDGPNQWMTAAALLAAAIASGAALLLLGRPACESALPATARRHALWQAIWKSDATSVRAAELMGRDVRGWSAGLPPLGGGAGALVAKAVVYGWRNSPWGAVVALLMALAPLAGGPAILEALRRSQILDETALDWMPALLLGLVFAWSQRIRLTAREEFARLIYLRSLPLRSTSIVASILVTPTVTFSAFLGLLVLSCSLAFRETDFELSWLVVGVTPLLYAALGAVHLASAMLYPTYDPSFGKGFLTDLALLPAAALVMGSVVGLGALAWLAGMGGPAVVLISGAAALGWLALGLRVAALLLDRMEPGG